MYKPVARQWCWVNGEVALPSVALWLPLQPSEDVHVEENCGEIHSSREGGYGTNNVPCNVERFGLCEKKVEIDDL